MGYDGSYATKPRRYGSALMMQHDGRRAVALVAVVAEDEPLFRMEIADLLGEAGFEVIEAGTAAGALARFEDGGGIDLLVTDVRMPGRLDGVALAQAVDGRWPETRIIVCSGVKDLDRATLPAKAEVFGKPYDPRAVAAAVRRAVRKPG